MTAMLVAMLSLAAGRAGAFQGRNTFSSTDIHVWVSRDIAPSSKVQLTINTTNQPLVHVNILPIDGEKWFKNTQTYPARPQAIGAVVAHYEVKVQQTGQRISPGRNYFSRQVNLPKLKSGVYLVNLAAGGESAWAVVDVTNLAVVVKQSPEKTLCWVTDFKTGKPVPGAKLQVLGISFDYHRNCSTGADGAVLFPSTPGQYLMLVKHGHDLAVLHASSVNPDGRLRCLFQTDRPIYRPGQTIDFKAILRLTKGQVYSDVAHSPVVVELRDARDNPIDRQTVQSNAIGSVAGSFQIPEEGLPGPYSLVLQAAGQRAYQTVTVAAYRKPEFSVTISPTKPYFFSGEDVVYNVDAEYYFGAPVPQAQISWVGRRQDEPMVFGTADQSWFYGGDGNLYPSDTYNQSPFNAEGKVYTDSHGHAQIVLHTKKNSPDSVLSVSTSVTDSDNREVSQSGSADVFRSGIRIGIEDLKYAVNLGGLIPLRIHVETVEGAPTARRVTVRAFTLVYDQKTETYVKRELASKVVQVPSTGVVYLTMPALAEGDEYFTADGKDNQGRPTSANSSVWVAGIHDIALSDDSKDPTIGVKLDRKSYEPGQAVHTYVQTNVTNRPMLVVLQGGDIYGYKVLYPKHLQALATFAASVKESPNAWIEACQWSKVGLISSNSIVPVPDRTKALNIKVTPDKEAYEPGDKASFTVITKNSKGVGIPAEVALSVIDEAIYALSPDTTPDPYGFFWGLRGDRVGTFSSEPEELSGGAYQNAQSTAPVRQQFKDTALWSPFVETGADGTAHVSFELPGNLTQWRATARAVTGATQVGVTKTDILATRPLTLRLATPRIMTVGDSISLTSTVNNRTAKKVNVVVSLEAKGAALGSETSKTISVDPHGEASVQFQVSVDSMPASGSCVITGRATAEPANENVGVDDAVQQSIAVIPRGVLRSGAIGGTVGKTVTDSVNLPTDAMAEGSEMRAKLYSGFQSQSKNWAHELIKSGRFGTFWAANALEAASAIGDSPSDENLKEAFALLSRDQNSNGWGWWDGAPTEADITAAVALALAHARDRKFPVYQNELDFAKSACEQLFAGSNLWDEKAQLVAALLALGDNRGPEFAHQVIEKGEKVSPYSWLLLAENLHQDHSDAGLEIVKRVMKLVSDGPSKAYLPVGFGVGWNASSTQTTAQLLLTLHQYRVNPELQNRLVLWLATTAQEDYPDSNDLTSVVRAFAEFGKDHTDATSLGQSTLTVNGHSFPLNMSTVDGSETVNEREFLLHAGANTVQLTRKGDGTAFYTLDWEYYRRQFNESTSGLRVVRRYEVRNSAGVWEEVHGTVMANQPVRCTVAVWGDSVPDAIKVTEPLPAGFEFVDSDRTAGAYEAVLDGKVVHYLQNVGEPVYFRYYLRPEEAGTLIAIPATAEFVRRPNEHGQSQAVPIQVNP